MSDPRVQRRWLLAVAVGVLLALALVLIFLLAQATGNRELYERYYPALFALNLLVAGVLVLTIGWMAVRLAVRWRQGRFGSRLLLKLAAIFALVGFVPGLLIYGVSYQFVARSIESWFDVKVEGALNAGLGLGRSALDTLAKDLGQKTEALSSEVADASDATLGFALERLRNRLGAEDVVVWSLSGQVVASAGESRFKLVPERPSSSQLRLSRTQALQTSIEGLEEAELLGNGRARIKVLLRLPPAGLGLLMEPRLLQVTQALPPSMVADAQAVEQAYREYQERALGREGLRTMYIGTLTLTLFLAIFGALLLAALLGNQLARPLLLLAAGVRDVAAGDLSPKPALLGRDELEGLTRSFAEMTRQLGETRSALDRSMQQVSTARANLQTILDNLTAGVLVLDADGHLLRINPGATRILRIPLAAWEQKKLADVPGMALFAQAIAHEFESFEGERSQSGVDHWQQSVELQGVPPALSAMAANVPSVTLLARGALLPNAQRLVVFDDISEIISAQRAMAWGEVARRLAHEIKNPLTPIQLSAERLAMKLEGKLGDAEAQVVQKSVRTIVDQVDAMKRLVNEFRDYGRLPQAKLEPIDLNLLVRDVLQLYSAEPGHANIALELEPDCPAILGDPQQLRQVIHNLLQNAQDAVEGQEPSRISIATQASPTSGRVRLVIRDSGPGFPPAILQRAFEPYVTTKAKGTGLGLAVVKKIADEHQARIELKNRENEGRVIGAQVSLSFKVAAATAAALA